MATSQERRHPHHDDDEAFRAASALMHAFAQRTGLIGNAPPKRYLWTDAFAVCNFLELGDNDRAERLVDQVHRILGRHRPDDARTGWIGGMDEETGTEHPTRGGLRIGKPLPERDPCLIGRGSDADITIDSRSISRRHAQLHQADGFAIEDLARGRRVNVLVAREGYVPSWTAGVEAPTARPRRAIA